jgi:sugar/nucleoside kinase (ribokinase family)
MSYDDLVDRLADDPDERTVTALPDGSVDVFYALRDAEGDRIEDRETFADRLTDGEPSFPVERESTEPGGQAVNMARQANALGDRVRLFGHLDDPVFDGLDVERVSMGEPSRIEVYPLDEDVLFTENSSELTDWTLEEFRIAADRPAERLSADAVCCGNWASVAGLTDAFIDLAESAIDGGLFLLDPGPISVRSDGAITDLLDALSALESTYDVVLSVNPAELETAAAVTDEGDGTGDTGSVDERERLVALRDRTEIGAAVLHAASEAVAATDEGVVAVEEPVRRTGAGDRFGAGLVHGLARDWGWESALALGNACASYAVATAGTADRAALRSWLA